MSQFYIITTISIKRYNLHSQKNVKYLAINAAKRCKKEVESKIDIKVQKTKKKKQKKTKKNKLQKTKNSQITLEKQGREFCPIKCQDLL